MPTALGTLLPSKLIVLERPQLLMFVQVRKVTCPIMISILTLLLASSLSAHPDEAVQPWQIASTDMYIAQGMAKEDSQYQVSYLVNGSSVLATWAHCES